MELQISQFWLSKEHSTINSSRNLIMMYWILFVQYRFENSKFYKQCVRLLIALLSPRNFAVFESQFLLEYYTQRTKYFTKWYVNENKCKARFKYFLGECDSNPHYKLMALALIVLEIHHYFILCPCWRWYVAINILFNLHFFEPDIVHENSVNSEN